MNLKAFLLKYGRIYNIYILHSPQATGIKMDFVFWRKAFRSMFRKFIHKDGTPLKVYGNIDANNYPDDNIC